MAIYHLHAEVGHHWGSATAKFSYISRRGKYRNSGDAVEHRASGRMPAWAESDARIFWRAADEYERKNGRLYREYEFSLPRELSPAQRAAAAEEFAERITADQSLPWSLAVHAGGGGNPHCHLILNERSNDGLARSAKTWFRRYKASDPAAAGAKKTRALIAPKKLVWIREQWAVAANQALAAAGSDVRIDHRSLARQGIEREPTRHVGAGVLGMERRGIRTDRGIDPAVEPGELALVRDARATLPTTTPTTGQEVIDEKRERARNRNRGNNRRTRKAKRADGAHQCRARRNQRRADSIRAAEQRRAELVRTGLAASGRGGGANPDRDRGGGAGLDQGGAGGLRMVPTRDGHATRDVGVHGDPAGAGGGAQRPGAGGGGSSRVVPHQSPGGGDEPGHMLTPGGPGASGSGRELTPGAGQGISWQRLLPLPGQRRAAAPGGAGGDAVRRDDVAAPAVRYRGRRTGRVALLIRREDPPSSFARPRLIDAGQRLAVGSGGEDLDRRAMLAMAARRWELLDLSAGSEAAARSMIKDATAVGVARERVDELRYQGADGSVVAVRGAALDRWFTAETRAGAGPRPPEPGPGPAPGPGPSMG